MNGNNHFLFGAAVAASTALLFNLSPDNSTLLISTALIGSIFPDIDNPKSHFGQLTKPVSTSIGKISRLAGKTGSHHRGIFHDIAFYLALGYLSYKYIPSLLGFFLGILSHLFLDSMNPAGVYFFGKRISVAKIPSNHKIASVITWALSILLICLSAYPKFAPLLAAHFTQ